MRNSPTLQGTRFEAEVAQLLGARGLNVSAEQNLGHKKIDLYFEEVRFGSRRRIAVECKSNSRRLSKQEVAQIYSDYLPLIEANRIDEILVVTLSGLAPAAQAYVSDSRHMLHVTAADLLHDAIDFRGYLEDLVRLFKGSPVSEYYVPPRLEDGQDLEAVVNKWLAGGIQPLAILGSYGLGKTTFVNRLACELAQKAQKQSEARIPIVIRLGDIGSEQSLEGLLGKLLAASTVVPRYSFPTFMKLNSLGRFVVLLDGFDEMKHTLNWETFRYNFAELNRLVVPESRVVLLGRPTAFVSDKEHKYALHGITEFAGREIRDLEWPDYHELTIGTFSKSQVDTFIHKYVQYRRHDIRMRRETLGASRELDAELFRVNELAATGGELLATKSLADIARRPVQLVMLAEVIPQWRGEMEDLTTAVLYSEFIDLVITRELKKDSRLRFDRADRRAFARALAWWLWTRPRTDTAIVTASVIPDDIILRFAKRHEDIPEVRRDLVAACFLDRKLGEALYFPHRSFQEFLVAEEVIHRLNEAAAAVIRGGVLNVGEFAILDPFITDDVASFIKGSVNLRDIQRWDALLLRYKGTMSWRLAQVWLSDRGFTEYLYNRFLETTSPWYPLLLAASAARGDSVVHSVDTFADDLRLKIEGALRDLKPDRTQVDRESRMAYALICLLSLLAISERLRTTKPVVEAMLSMLQLRGASDTTREAAHTRSAERTRRARTVPDKIAVELAQRLGINHRRNSIETGGLYKWLSAKLRTQCMISEWIVGETIRPSDIDLPSKVHLTLPSELPNVISRIVQVREEGAGEGRKPQA